MDTRSVQEQSCIFGLAGSSFVHARFGQEQPCAHQVWLGAVLCTPAALCTAGAVLVSASETSFLESSGHEILIFMI